MHVSWQSVAERFQKNRAAAIPSRWLIPPKKLEEAQRSTRPLSLIPRFLSHHELQITGLGAAALARGIRTGAFSCLQVAEAFCRQAAVAQQLTNCLTEVFFTEALDRARQLDDMLTAAKGVPIGPLHGVPISVMDHIDVKGQHTTSGYVAYAETSVVKGADALLVETLRDAGAVLYCKTNTPQFMMVLETVNNIYGRTLNPWNTKLAAGGSGEGVLLALRGSPLGVGADLGGSIRAPAAFNGLYGFKPSAGRVSTSGWGSTLAGQESIAAVAGPLAHNVEDMDLFMQVLADSKPWLKEPLLNMPWRSQIGASEARTLTVGVMLWDEVVLPHPYITRVISEVAVKLGKAGHDVIPFRPLEHGRALDEILLPLSFTDGGLDIQHTLFEGNEPIFPAAKRLLEEVQIKGRTKDEIRELILARDDYRTLYLRRWAETAKASKSGQPIDVLICPAASLNSAPHDIMPWWGYAAQWNLLDYPCGVMPAGKVLETDAYPDGYEPVGERDRENVHLYDNSLYLGMPVAIQVVGPAHEDEKVLGAMSIIDKIIHG